MSINSQFCESEGNYTCAPNRLRETRWLETERGLFLSDLAANQLAGIVVILDDIDVTALLQISLNNRQLAVPEFLDFLGFAIKIVIADLADQNPVRVHLHQINRAIKIRSLSICTT